MIAMSMSSTENENAKMLSDLMDCSKWQTYFLQCKVCAVEFKQRKV
jgi:hypothetical protein